MLGTFPSATSQMYIFQSGHNGIFPIKEVLNEHLSLTFFFKLSIFLKKIHNFKKHFILFSLKNMLTAYTLSSKNKNLLNEAFWG